MNNRVSFQVRLETVGEAFEDTDEVRAEIARLLRSVAQNVEDGYGMGMLPDNTGAWRGEWSWD